MKVKSLNAVPLAIFDASFTRHVIPAGSEYEIPDDTNVNDLVDRGMLVIVQEGQQNLLSDDDSGANSDSNADNDADGDKQSENEEAKASGKKGGK